MDQELALVDFVPFPAQQSRRRCPSVNRCARQRPNAGRRSPGPRGQATGPDAGPRKATTKQPRNHNGARARARRRLYLRQSALGDRFHVAAGFVFQKGTRVPIAAFQVPAEPHAHPPAALVRHHVCRWLSLGTPARVRRGVQTHTSARTRTHTQTRKHAPPLSHTHTHSRAQSQTQLRPRTHAIDRQHRHDEATSRGTRTAVCLRLCRACPLPRFRRTVWTPPPSPHCGGQRGCGSPKGEQRHITTTTGARAGTVDWVRRGGGIAAGSGVASRAPADEWDGAGIARLARVAAWRGSLHVPLAVFLALFPHPVIRRVILAIMLCPAQRVRNGSAAAATRGQ